MITRWLFSTKAKDIGTFFIMLGIFTGLLAIGFSILIRLELYALSNQYFALNVISNTSLIIGFIIFIVSIGTSNMVYSRFIILSFGVVLVLVSVYVILKVTSDVTLLGRPLSTDTIWLLSAKEPNILTDIATAAGDGVGSGISKGIVKAVSDNVRYIALVPAIRKLRSSVKGPVSVKLAAFSGAIGMGIVGRLGIDTIKAYKARSSGRLSTNISNAIKINNTSASTLQSTNPENRNMTAHSPIEENETQELLGWLYNHMLPNWLQQDLRIRVSKPISRIEGDYSILFAQYNYIINLLLYMVIAIMISICFSVLVHFIAVYREQLVNKVKVSLGKYIINWLAKNRYIIILLNVVGIFLNVLARYKGLAYLYEHYIPANLGTYCDMILDPKK